MIYTKFAAGTKERAPTQAELDELKLETHNQAMAHLKRLANGPNVEAKAAAQTVIRAFGELTDAEKRQLEWDRLKAAQHIMQCGWYYVSIPMCDYVAGLLLKPKSSKQSTRSNITFNMY